MEGFLQRVLDLTGIKVRLGLEAIEKNSINPSVDTRLVSDMIVKGYDIIKNLGLDKNNTTAKELYYALNSQYKNSNIEKILLDCDYVVIPIDGQIVSLNLIDIIENDHHKLSFEKRLLDHGRRALRGEILYRYENYGKIDLNRLEDLANSIGLLNIEDKHHIHTVKKYKINKDRKPVMFAIGDMVTDAFIKLNENYAQVTVDRHGHKSLSMDFGNKPPYDEVEVINAVGNSANAAVAFARLGLDSGLLAFCGNDQAGKDSLKYLSSQGVDISAISIQSGKKTNYHYALRYGSDRTILIKYEDYDYEFKIPKEKPDWIYLSMLSKSSWSLHRQLLKYLKKNPDVNFAFQPGTFHFEWGTKRLSEFYKRSFIVMMNKEEAQQVTNDSTKSISKLLQKLASIGPKMVVITDGPNGSFAYDGVKIYAMPNYPDPKPPYDRTGAGDAFASTVVACLAMGQDLPTAMQWAPINAMSVVQKLGAQAGLLNKSEIKNYLAKAPRNYKIQEFNL